MALKKYILSFCLFITPFLSLCQAGKNDAHDKGLLWRISGNGLTKASYLFGSIDVICKDQYIWTPKMQECYKSCDKVCLKLNPSGANMGATLAAVMNKNGKTLKDYFDPKDYPAVSSYAQSTLGLDLSLVQRLQPIALQIFIVKHLLGCSTVTYLQTIGSLAQKDGKEVMSAETVADEMNVIAQTHYNEKMVKVFVDMTHGSQYYATFRQSEEKAYQLQDLAGINKIVRELDFFSESDRNVLLTETSKRQESVMPEMMKQGSVFFVFNWFNLPGSDGIIRLLEQAGYTVEPVM